MPSLRALSAALTAALLLAGCRSDPEATTVTVQTVPTPDTAVLAADTAEVPVPATGTMRIEGTDVPVTLVPLDVTALPFTSALPEGEFEARAARDGAADVLTLDWVRARSDSGTPRATVVVAPPGVSPDSLLAAFVRDGSAAGRTVATDAGASPCLWAVEGHPFTDEVSGATGIVCVGVHAGRAFRLVTESDPERAEGFAARLDVVLREWRWRDTGLGLDDGAPVL